jgi:hypothetical protein
MKKIENLERIGEYIKKRPKCVGVGVDPHLEA